MCPKGHEWPASVANRTRRGDSCPYCSGKVATSETCLQTRNFNSVEIQCKADKEKDLSDAIKRILIYLEIHVFLEGIVMKHSIKDIDISIKKDYLEILNNAKKNEKERSLAFLYPKISKEWNKEKNQQLSPWNFTPGSNEPVW